MSAGVPGGTGEPTASAFAAPPSTRANTARHRRGTTWASGSVLLTGLLLGWLVGRPAAEANPLPPGKDMELVTGRCVICHSLELVAQQRQDRGGWEAILDRMITYGAPIAPEEKQPILDYLVTHFGS